MGDASVVLGWWTRKLNRKSRERLVAIKEKACVVSFGKTSGDGKANSGTTTLWLGCKERFEELIGDLGRNTGATVFNRQIYPLLIFANFNAQPSVVALEGWVAHRDRIKGIVDEIHQNLRNLNWTGDDGAIDGLDVDGNFNLIETDALLANVESEVDYIF